MTIFTTEEIEICECEDCGFRYDAGHYDTAELQNCASCQLDELREEVTHWKTKFAELWAEAYPDRDPPEGE